MLRKLIAIVTTTALVLSVTACGRNQDNNVGTGNTVVGTSEGYKRIVLKDISLELPNEIEYKQVDESCYMGGNADMVITVSVSEKGEYTLDHEGMELAKVGDKNVYVWHAVDMMDTGPFYSASIEFNHNGFGHQVLISGGDEGIVNQAFEHAFETLIIE